MQVDKLQQIIESSLKVKILSASRFREYVDGRIIFTKILFDMGLPISYIARMLCKDHATAIHYRRKFDDLSVGDSSFREKYYNVKDAFFKEEDISLLNNNGELTREVDMLRHSIGRLEMENEIATSLKNEMSQMKETISRLLEENETLKIKMGLALRPSRKLSSLDNETQMNEPQEIERARIISSMTDDYHESINDIYEMLVDKEHDQAKQEIRALQSDLSSLLKFIDNDVRNTGRPR